MMGLSADKEAEIIEAFNSTSRYFDDVLNINNTYFDGMVNNIYPSELQLNKANSSDIEAPFLDLHLTISDGFVSSKMYDKHDDFDFDIVTCPVLDGDVPRATTYVVYISQLIRFARVSSHVSNKVFGITFSKFFRRHYDLVSKFKTELKSLLKQGLSEPESDGDLVYRFRKIVARNDFSDQFSKIIIRHKRIGYTMNVMRQTACLVVKSITVNNFATLLNCTPAGLASDLMAPA